MSIRSKIFLSFSVVVALFVLNGVVSIRTLNKNKQLAEHTLDVVMPSSDAVDSLTLMLVESKMYTTNWVFLRYNEDDKRSLQLIHNGQYDRLRKKMEGCARQWHNAAWSDSLREIFVRFDALLRVEQTIMASLNSFGAYNDPAVKLEAELMLEDEVLPRSAALLSSLNNLNESIKRVSQEDNDNRARASAALMTQIIILSVGIF
ncbi:MAG: hypothetical protein JST42_27230, partial [Bacteroidetes bacterium]|nr:hypothetical protein [Bacteroidota bacterium]